VLAENPGFPFVRLPVFRHFELPFKRLPRLLSRSTTRTALCNPQPAINESMKALYGGLPGATTVPDLLIPRNISVMQAQRLARLAAARHMRRVCGFVTRSREYAICVEHFAQLNSRDARRPVFATANSDKELVLDATKVTSTRPLLGHAISLKVAIPSR